LAASEGRGSPCDSLPDAFTFQPAFRQFADPHVTLQLLKPFAGKSEPLPIFPEMEDAEIQAVISASTNLKQIEGD
jgi:hypothetical protein